MTNTDAPQVETQLPSPIQTDPSNAFAHHSMSVRVPGIIKEVIDRNTDYPGNIKKELLHLREDIVNDMPVRLFDAPAPDYDLWATPFETRKKETWLNTEWLFAEMLAYRLIIEATQYWTTLRDPFAPLKKDELESNVLWDALSRAMDKSGNRETRLARCLRFSLWGNRIDLSLKQAANLGTQAKDEHLLQDDIHEAVDYLTQNSPGIIHIIMDNAGTEQAVDFALIDHMLTENIARKVYVHVKMQPVLVSDAIVADVHILLDYMARHSTITNLLAIRLKNYLNNGRISIVPDFFWNTAGRLWELPNRIQLAFQDATLVISKGDLNYRRATNDAIWPPSTTFLHAIQNFPSPLLALRTLKSDTLVGIAEDLQTRLNDEHGPKWRTSGTYGVAQFAFKPDSHSV